MPLSKSVGGRSYSFINGPQARVDYIFNWERKSHIRILLILRPKPIKWTTTIRRRAVIRRSGDKLTKGVAGTCRLARVV